MTCLNPSIFILAGLVLAGSAGMTSAQADCHDVVRDMEGQTVHSSNGNCVRTQWTADQDVCGSQHVVQQTTVGHWQETRTVSVPTQEERTVYFEFNRAALTPEG